MPIVYKRADGGISICIPCISKDDPEGFSQEDAYIRAKNKDIPVDATDIIQIDASLIPKNDVFRNAWDSFDEKGNVTYDIAKAKTLVDTFLANEMMSHASKLDLVNKMGRSTTNIEADMADCKNRIANLDTLVISEKSDADILSTLKSLIKE